jgi:hypothetical protein
LCAVLFGSPNSRPSSDTVQCGRAIENADNSRNAFSTDETAYFRLFSPSERSGWPV